MNFFEDFDIKKHEIKECKYGESEHPDLQGVETHDEGIEWMKWAYVMIFEAYK